MSPLQQTRIACVGIVAVAAIIAVVLLITLAGAEKTGNVARRICPDNTKPVLVEGPGGWAREIADYERRGGYCFWAEDGITPCCGRTPAYQH